MFVFNRGKISTFFLQAPFVKYKRRKMSNNYKKTDLVEKIEKDLAEEEKLKFMFEQESMDARIQKRKGFIRRLQLECREAGLDGVVLKAQEVANLQSNEIEQEEKLAAELSSIRHKEIKDEKMRQLLRENNHELRELESQLKAAYANKILATQIAEKEARKIQEQMFEEKVREVMLNTLGSAEEFEKRAMEVEKEMKEEYRRTLQDQIIERERLRQEEYMAYIKEKKLFEDTIKKIKDEEEKEKAEKLLMKQKIKEEMEQFYKAREVWKARERILIDKENQKLEEIIKMKEKLESERKEKKKSNTEERERVLEQMRKEILTQKKLKEERLDMVKLLKENEFEEMERAKVREDIERQLARRREGRTEFQKLLAEKERKHKEDKELDARFAEQMNLKVKEEEMKEREKMESKRKRRVEDRIYNERKIKENIQNHAENLKLIQMSIEFEEKEQKKREEMIEEERIRILKEHAPHLLGYLPKGCLKEKDLEVLGITGNSPLPKGNPFVQDNN